MPVRTAAPAPWFHLWDITNAPAARAMSAVPSVEPSSTTSTSAQGAFSRSSRTTAPYVGAFVLAGDDGKHTAAPVFAGRGSRRARRTDDRTGGASLLRGPFSRNAVVSGTEPVDKYRCKDQREDEKDRVPWYHRSAVARGGFCRCVAVDTVAAGRSRRARSRRYPRRQCVNSFLSASRPRVSCLRHAVMRKAVRPARFRRAARAGTHCRSPSGRPLLSASTSWNIPQVEALPVSPVMRFPNPPSGAKTIWPCVLFDSISEASSSVPSSMSGCPDTDREPVSPGAPARIE